MADEARTGAPDRRDRQAEEALGRPGPLVGYAAPAGDAAARDKVVALIRDRGWADWLGDLGRQATRQLIFKAAGGDRVWEAGITEKANTPGGTAGRAADRIGRVACAAGGERVHARELELTIRPPLNAHPGAPR